MTQQSDKQKRLDEIKDMAKNRGNGSQAQSSNDPWAKETPAIPSNKRPGGYKTWN